MKCILVLAALIAVASPAVADDLDTAHAICEKHREMKHLRPLPGQAPELVYQPEFLEKCTAVDQALSVRSGESKAQTRASDLDALQQVAPQQ